MTGRTNQHDVDLNRNFPDQFAQTDENKAQEMETVAVMAWIQSLPFVLSANLHGGTLVANYPFDDSRSGTSSYSKSPDDGTFQMVAEAYSLVSDRTWDAILIILEYGAISDKDYDKDYLK